MNMEIVLARLVQIGTVSTVDDSQKTARVIFKDTGIMSGWLYIMKHYTPSINDKVLVLYLPVENADGFIIGGI